MLEEYVERIKEAININHESWLKIQTKSKIVTIHINLKTKCTKNKYSDLL